MSEETKEETIVERVRKGSGFLDTSFNTDLLTYINIASYDLFQNAVIKQPKIYEDTKVSDLESNTDDSESIISYLTINAKLLLDPPQPSMVATYNATISRLLDRLHMEATRSNEEVEE